MAIIHRTSLASISTVAAIAALSLGTLQTSCSEDSGGGGGGRGGSTGATGGSGGSGGSSATGGGSGTGGTAGTGGTGATGDGGNEYTCGTGPDPDPGGSADENGACCDGLGTCTKSGNVDATQREAFGLDDCKAGADLLCAPNLADAGARATCRSAGDTEGRCIPDCFLLGRPEAVNLPEEGCAAGERCAPCFSPIDGSDTGACSINGDQPTEQAKTFQTCEDPNGLCVPSEQALKVTSLLSQLTCPDGYVCAPKDKVIDPSTCYAQCESIGGAQGACVKKFAVPETYHAALPQGACDATELCAPCISPLDNARTGACD